VTLEQARALHPDLNFRKGNILELEFAVDSISGVVATSVCLMAVSTEAMGSALQINS
jgi:hypothetical protein